MSEKMNTFHLMQIIKQPLGRVAHSLTCLTADPGIASSIHAWSRTFMEINHEIISTVILLPSADSRRVFVSYKQKYVHEILVNMFVKLAKEKDQKKIFKTTPVIT